MPLVEAWLHRVRPHFDFLLEQGYRLEGGETSAWETWVQYVSATNAVRVTRSFEFQRAEVELIRLADGQVPPPGKDHIHYFALLDNVVEARTPGQSPVPGGLSDDEVEAQLASWSAALRSAASDFLAGDCAAIDEAEAVVRERMRQHPWPPDPQS